jgi:Domain of unknown function (DUF4261)
MQRELILCIPGPWKERNEFIGAIITKTKGEFMFAGMILANPKGKDHVGLEFRTRDPQLRQAFEIAGRGKLPARLLDEIEQHQGIAYVHFPVQIISEKERVVTFTEVLRTCGGLAVKVESCGVAHQWEPWLAALRSENPFDFYRTFVVLICDSDYYYSCGMHHFGLPDVEVERSVETKEAADLMNRFNYWQIVDEPKIASGHTFSVTADAPWYRITQRNDARHEASHLFYNQKGLWSLKRKEDR